MNDSFRSNVFVRFSPETIACACIYLAARYLQIALPNSPPWYSLFRVSEEDLKEISRSILRLYTRPKPNMDELEKLITELKAQVKLRAKSSTHAASSTPIVASNPGTPDQTSSLHSPANSHDSREHRDCSNRDHSSRDHKGGDRLKKSSSSASIVPTTLGDIVKRASLDKKVKSSADLGDMDRKNKHKVNNRHSRDRRTHSRSPIIIKDSHYDSHARESKRQENKEYSKERSDRDHSRDHSVKDQSRKDHSIKDHIGRIRGADDKGKKSHSSSLPLGDNMKRVAIETKLKSLSELKEIERKKYKADERVWKADERVKVKRSRSRSHSNSRDSTYEHSRDSKRRRPADHALEKNFKHSI